MSYENLEKIKDEIYGCSICGQCVQGPVDPFRPNPVFHDYLPDKTCPMREKDKFLTYSGAGMNTIARALLEGGLEITDELAEAIYECVLCDHCETSCGEVFHLIKTMVGKDIGHGVRTPDVVRAFRADIVKAGKGPTENVKKVAAAIEKGHNRFARPQSERTAWVPKEIQIPAKADLVFYVGCMAAYRNAENAQSFAKILKKAGVDFTILGEEEWCCGGPQLLNAGLIEQFKAQAKHNVDAIKATGAKEVVTTCADCYRTLKYDYPKIVGDLGFTVLHSTELLAKLIEEKKITLTKEIKETVTFQDPCQLSRVAKITDAPRKILESIPGLKFVEMEGNKEYTVCCGHYPVELPQTTLLAGTNRIGDARKVGADTMITACSFCKWSFNNATRKLGADTKVKDITEIVAEAMGL
jgi:heterodisulfide reductase subunit D